MIYNFDNGHVSRYFEESGILKRNVAGYFELRNIDFSKQLNLGHASWNEQGAYIFDARGNQHSVFYYKKRFHFEYEGRPKGNPKFHIAKCEAIKTYSGYIASNVNLVTVIDARSGVPRELELELCILCRRIVMDSPLTTAAFFEKVQAEGELINETDSEVKVDLHGYTLDWPRISKVYRKSKDYACESCSISLETDRRFLHVHHKNHDKTDNNIENLESLCMLCHKHQDALHECNFEERRMNQQLTRFVEKHSDALRACGNQYIDRDVKEQNEQNEQYNSILEDVEFDF